VIIQIKILSLPKQKHNNMRVKDHKKFAYFHYISQPNVNNVLGDILYRSTEDGEEIGVIIQTYKEGDNRTDTWGNDDVTQLATLEQIKRLRPELLNEILEIPQ